MLANTPWAGSSEKTRRLLGGATGGGNGPQNKNVVDSGNSYGDINDSNMEGEEMLENIDYFSLKMFPVVFGLYLLIFWCTFLVF